MQSWVFGLMFAQCADAWLLNSCKHRLRQLYTELSLCLALALPLPSSSSSSASLSLSALSPCVRPVYTYTMLRTIQQNAERPCVAVASLLACLLTPANIHIQAGTLNCTAEVLCSIQPYRFEALSRHPAHLKPINEAEMLAVKASRILADLHHLKPNNLTQNPGDEPVARGCAAVGEGLGLWWLRILPFACVASGIWGS